MLCVGAFAVWTLIRPYLCPPGAARYTREGGTKGLVGEGSSSLPRRQCACDSHCPPLSCSLSTTPREQLFCRLDFPGLVWGSGESVGGGSAMLCTPLTCGLCIRKADPNTEPYMTPGAGLGVSSFPSHWISQEIRRPWSRGVTVQIWTVPSLLPAVIFSKWLSLQVSIFSLHVKWKY